MGNCFSVSDYIRFQIQREQAQNDSGHPSPVVCAPRKVLALPHLDMQAMREDGGVQAMQQDDGVNKDDDLPKSKSKSEKVDEIRQEDCPNWTARGYPGKFNRHNRSGTLKTRDEWKQEEVRRWFGHFRDNPKYENTSVANKVMYLVTHLKVLKVKSGEARTLLVRAETEADEDGELQGRDVVDPVVEANPSDGREVLGDGRGEGDDAGVGDGDMDVDTNEDKGEEREEGEMDCDIGGEKGRSTVEFEVRKYLAKTDHELFETDLSIPTCVQNSRKFNARKNEYVRVYLEEHEMTTSQEMLEHFSQVPEAVQETIRESLVHLTKQEKSTRLLPKTLSDTLKRLKETPGREARKQVQVILAAASHHR